MKGIVFIIAISYLFLPLQFALNPTDTVDLALFRVLSVCITIAFAGVSFASRTFYIPRGWVAGCVAVFLMWASFSLFYSPVPLWTLRKLVFLYTFFPLFFVLTAVFVTQKNALQKIITYLVGGGCIIAGISIGQFCAQFFLSLETVLRAWENITPFFLGNAFATAVITYNSWLVHVGGHDIMRAIAFFPDPHVFAFYLGMMIPLAVYVARTTRNLWWYIATAIIFCADILTFSRGGYMGLVAGGVLALIVFWRALSTRMRHVVVLCALSIVLCAGIPHNPVTQRFISSFSQNDTSVTHRITLWSDALTHIAHTPLIGTGLGAYAYTASTEADYRTPLYIHNFYLDLWAELGVIGLLLFCGMCLATVYALAHNARAPHARFAIISIGIFLVHSVFDTALFSVHVLPVLVLLFALGSHSENTPRSS